MLNTLLVLQVYIVVNTAVLQVYMVVGGWKSGGWTTTTETLVEGGSAWTLHPGTLPDGGFGDSGILNYNNVLYLFGGEDWLEGRGYADRKTVQHCRDQRSGATRGPRLRCC